VKVKKMLNKQLKMKRKPKKKNNFSFIVIIKIFRLKKNFQKKNSIHACVCAAQSQQAFIALK
jgi:hypothetical protein